MTEPPDFDSIIRQFESAWQQGNPPEIADVLTTAGFGESGSLRENLLNELVCIHLEFR